jgi:hypothetical protein
VTVIGPASPSSGLARPAQAVATIDPEELIHRRALFGGVVIGPWPESHCREVLGEKLLEVPPTAEAIALAKLFEKVPKCAEMCFICFGNDPEDAVAEVERLIRRAA